AQYKANRKKADEDLVSQLARARDMVEAMGFGCVQQPGFEADDIMATLACRARGEGFESVLVTGDKDVLQLVGPGIRVLNPSKPAWMDPPEIEKKLGVGPREVVDYLALIGDASDNIPGVRGIGPVGAVKLIKRFGSLASAVAAAKAKDPDIPPKTAAALVTGERAALDAVRLLTLDREVPIASPLTGFKLPEPDPDRIKAVFGRLEFGSLLGEILPRSGEAALAAPELAAALPASGAVAAGAAIRELPLAQLRGELARAAAVTVAARLNPAPDLAQGRVLGAFGLPDGRTAVLDEGALRAELAFLRGMLGGPALKVGYDLKATRAALETLELRPAGRFFDTMLAAYCLDPAGSGRRPAGKDLRASLLEAAAAGLNHEVLREGMESAGVLWLFEDIEMPLAEVLRGMEALGIRVDGACLRRLAEEFSADARGLKAEICRLAGADCNLNSPKQLAALLYDRLGLPVPHETAKGGRSTDEEALRLLAKSHPVAGKLIEYRELAKLKSTYVDGLLERLEPDSRVRTHFDQTGTATGRLSSLEPNLQNIPARSPAGQRIRRAFTAAEGCLLVSADYSQIDLRVLAHVSEDRDLCAAFASNQDVHLRTACEVFGKAPPEVDRELRRRAKAINFGVVYGQSAFGLAAELGIGQAEAARYIQAYFARHEGVAAWIARNLESARRSGVVRTICGRIRHLPELHAKNAALRQFAERAARNTPIQGGSADIIKLAMLRAAEGLGEQPGARMLLQIHDELIFEVPRDSVGAFAPWIKGIMAGVMDLRVPLAADVKAGPNWQDMEELE
ncbi:MAG: DNA polymerase, partial [Elusimicrobia bacterium]|nr:DNA polymerase [Elusimicrobiota bacterium]